RMVLSRVMTSRLRHITARAHHRRWYVFASMPVSGFVLTCQPLSAHEYSEMISFRMSAVDDGARMAGMNLADLLMRHPFDDAERLEGAASYPDDVAFVMWTSGTTGRPKAIHHTHSAYVELLDRVLGPLRAGGGDTTKRPAPNLIPVSMALNAGLYNSLFGL